MYKNYFYKCVHEEIPQYVLKIFNKNVKKTVAVMRV